MILTVQEEEILLKYKSKVHNHLNDHFFYLEFKDLENQSGKTLQTASKSLQSSLKYAINHYVIDDFWRILRAR